MTEHGERIYDVQQLQSLAIGHEGLAKELIALALEAKVENDEHVSQAVDHLTRIQAVTKELEDERKGRQQDIQAGIKLVNNQYKNLTLPLDDAKKKLQKLLMDYNLNQRRLEREEAERKGIEAEDKALAEAEKIKANAETEAAKLRESGDENSARAVEDNAEQAAEAVIDEAADAPQEAPAEQSGFSGNYGGSAHQRTNWKWEVVKESMIPREWFMVDEKAISAVVRAGRREIPGIRIYSEKTFTGRR